MVDNKLRGAYGETDFDKGLIRINKKQHYKKGRKRFNPASDGHEKIYSTLNHELLHWKHPKATEKEIRKKEKSSARTMSKKRKAQLLSKLR